MVEDCKLQVANLGQDHPRPDYGSKEDNENAVKSLSVVDTSDSQSKESFAKLILQTLHNMSEVSITFFSFLLEILIILVYHKIDCYNFHF